MSPQEDNRFQIPFFMLVSGLSFFLFAGILYLLERQWNEGFLTAAIIGTLLSAVAFLIEWACRAFCWQKDKPTNDYTT